MLYSTHVVIGATIAPYVNMAFGIQHDPGTISQVVVGTLIGSGLPDLDHPKGTIGSLIPKVSEWINTQFDHRGFTHSFQAAGLTLVFSLLVVLPFYLIFGVNYFPLAIDIFVGALAHDFADCWNPAGVRLFGDHRVYHYYEDQSCSISVGSPEEYRLRAVWTVCLVLEIGMLLFPLNKVTYFVNHRPENAINIIREKLNKQEAVVDVYGYWKGTRFALDGGNPVRARILFLDDQKKSMAVALKGYPGIYVADFNGKDAAAALTVSKIDNIRFEPSILASRDTVVSENDLLDSHFPEESLISGTILTTMSDDLQRVLEATRPADSVQGAYAKTRQDGLVTYELRFFPVNRLREILPLYVEHASLRIFWRSRSGGN